MKDELVGKIMEGVSALSPKTYRYVIKKKTMDQLRKTYNTESPRENHIEFIKSNKRISKGIAKI